MQDHPQQHNITLIWASETANLRSFVHQSLKRVGVVVVVETYAFFTSHFRHLTSLSNVHRDALKTTLFSVKLFFFSSFY